MIKEIETKDKKLVTTDPSLKKKGKKIKKSKKIRKRSRIKGLK